MRRPWRVAVAGHSMEPALREGDWLLMLPPRRTPRRGDVVLFRDPRERSRLMLKRVVEVPDGALGDQIEHGVCAVCWDEWKAQQIRVINHYALRPALKEDREKLYDITREFFGLPSDGAAKR